MRMAVLAAAMIAGLSNAAHAQVLAEIGGVSITLNDVIAANPAAAKDQGARNSTLLTLINRQAVLNAAKKSDIEKSADFKRELKQATDTLIIQAMAKKCTDSYTVTDKDVEQKYKDIFDKPPPEQYRLREITTESYDAAQNAMNEIKNGAQFSAVAAERSQEAQTAALGGETGWLMDTQLLAPILKTVQGMKIGEVVGPVSVPNGYVVLQLMGKRQAPKPTLEQARQQLIATIKQQAWDKYVLKLRTEQGARLVTPLPEK